ncbi:MAG: molybdate ABC transporter substrate-binding protein [Sulfitobacter sp.]
MQALVAAVALTDSRAMKRLFSFAVPFLATVLLTCGGVRAERAVTVFAAASLGGALEEIARGYGVPVVFAYGGSGAMARQVAAGAPADLVVLANPQWMAWLEEQGSIAAGSAVVVTGNTLVLIAAKGAPAVSDISALPDLLAGARLAMGQRDAVPAGTYARQWLDHAGLWQAIAPHLAETDNVRAALALVARGDAPYGVVYGSDAQAEPAVEVVYDVPENSHDAILYPAAALTPEGAAFLARLVSAEAAAVFAAHGFKRPVE